MLVHDVFFTLKDPSPEATDALIAASRKYLSGHDGVVFFACGRLSELDRPVNQRDFHVGLHVVFESRDAHDAYQKAPRHRQFVRENESNWAKVRVFDTECEE